MHDLSVFQALKFSGRKRMLMFCNILFLCTLMAISVAAEDGFAPGVHQVRPLLVGAEVPDLTLTTADGNPFALRTEAQNRPYVLVFYRGHW